MPRFQVLVYSVFGISNLSTRMPGYLAAQVAILLLCFSLVRRRRPWSGVALAFFWLGDRSSREICMGRPEGMCLLFTVSGFLLLAKGLERRGSSALVWSGVLFSLAVGFNPAAGFSLLTAAVLLLLLSGKSERLSRASRFMLGCLPGFALILASWAPDLRASLEQFLWHLDIARGEAAAEGFFVTRILSGQHATQYFTLAAVLAAAVLLLPRLLQVYLSPARTSASVVYETCLLGFASSSALLFSQSSTYPYYAVLMSPWVVASVGLMVEGRHSLGPRLRIYTLCMAVALFLAWIPTLPWKALRTREAILLLEQLDKGPFISEVRNRLPSDQTVYGAGIYFAVASQAGVDFIPLPFLLSDPGLCAPSESWLLLSDRYRDKLAALPGGLDGHELRHVGHAFPDGPFPIHRYHIYAPKGAERLGSAEKRAR
ncbi:MAG: hypothetical protein ACYTG5_18775 [Planctomycetota bacterium]|jgi:hypothetical protein